MSGHESIRELLALAAAGVLDADQLRRAEEHATSCDECARELAAWRLVVAEIRRLPTPRAPGDLASRTVNRVRTQLAETADRRWDSAMLAVLTLFTWTLGLAGWAIVKLVGGGLFAMLDTGFATSLIWLTGSTVLVWMTAGAAAIVLSRRGRMARRNL